MNILLTGASGFIGGHLLPALRAAGHQVTPVARRYGFNFNQMQAISDWLPHLHGVDAVINSVGIIAETRGQTFAVLHHRAPAALFQALQVTPAQRTLDVVGAYPLAFVDWLQTLRLEQGRKAALTLPIPFGLMMAVAQAGQFVIPLLHPDNLRMLQQGNTADVQPLAAFLGRMPLSVEEGLCCI
ncbi:MAG: NAD-dependent epimerase/dehydratase family protein [Candidatus Thiothrix putei]|uniref:NAD-dependent epimerase/dehydratase family protein n=1 Tax=Candidatus Thiothrix putei TaxID=3080811 RepID=A0AA95HCM2_9GAMM|nr:MAG: NAD-dependent epimerase/dehydratase family protein [Candidatus Thiothrix putei]